MVNWKKVKRLHRNVSFLAKFMLFIKAPISNLQHISTILTGLGYAWASIKIIIMQGEQSKSDKIVSVAAETAKDIEAEVEKPLEEQDNEVLREAARRRANE